jgi:hypothetical protein
MTLGSFRVPEQADNHPCIQGNFQQPAIIPIMYRLSTQSEWQQLALRDISSGWNKKRRSVIQSAMDEFTTLTLPILCAVWYLVSLIASLKSRLFPWRILGTSTQHAIAKPGFSLSCSTSETGCDSWRQMSNEHSAFPGRCIQGGAANMLLT